MAPDYLTRGEQLAQRPLMAERRSGVPHYLTGQHHAIVETIDEEVGGGKACTLSYVDTMGEVVVAVLIQDEGAWLPMMIGRSGHQVFHGWVPAHETRFELSDKMLAAIERAEQEEGRR